jgi:hypothetical protein
MFNIKFIGPRYRDGSSTILHTTSTPHVGGTWEDTFYNLFHFNGQLLDAIQEVIISETESKYTGTVLVQEITPSSLRDPSGVPEYLPAEECRFRLQRGGWSFPGRWLTPVVTANTLGNFPKKTAEEE